MEATRSEARSARTSSGCRSTRSRSSCCGRGPPAKAAHLQRTRRRRSVAGVPATVLADIGGRAPIAVVGRRAVIIGEGAGGDPGAIIVQIADRVGQRIGVAMVSVMHPRLREAGG